MCEGQSLRKNVPFRGNVKFSNYGRKRAKYSRKYAKSKYLKTHDSWIYLTPDCLSPPETELPLNTDDVTYIP